MTIRSSVALVSAFAAVAFAANVSAQIVPGNSAGVAMGHLHFHVDDVAANTDFWVSLGGTAMRAGERIELPGVLIVLSEAPAGAEATLVDHVAFRVDSLDRIENLGFEVERLEAFPGIASIRAPSGARIELFEEGTATNVGFDASPGSPADATTGRHNRPLVGALDSHHLHFYLPEDQVLTARDWYVDHFGAVPGMRWRYAAADLPGMNLNFSAAPEPRRATAGQALDHIGFEIDDLEAFCARLEAAGVRFDQPFSRTDADFANAILTDPWGTTIELTEGLAAD